VERGFVEEERKGLRRWIIGVDLMGIDGWSLVEIGRVRRRVSMQACGLEERWWSVEEGKVLAT
jgi:hypothetical protein